MVKKLIKEIPLLIYEYQFLNNTFYSHRLSCFLLLFINAIVREYKLRKQMIYSNFQYAILLFPKIPRVRQTADNIEVKDLKTPVSGKKNKNRLPYLPEITRIPQQDETKKLKLYDYFL